jgi:hypothetical protein
MNDGLAGARPVEWGLMAWVVLAASLVVLNASVTFHNVYPTPAVGWRGELSIELAIFLVALSGLAAAGWLVPAGARRIIGVVWVVLTVGRYADVTAPALWGRQLNFFWDLRFLPEVLAMLGRAAGVPISAATGLALVAGLAACYWIERRAIDSVCTAAAFRGPRAVMLAAGGLLVAGYLTRPPTPPDTPPGTLDFPAAVSRSYAQQVLFAAKALRGAQALPPSPSFDGDLARARGADVLVFFLESYGAVAFERPDFREGLAEARATFYAAVRDTGLAVVSAFVESPTFGGASWFAHITLLSGIDVRDPDTNALLMTARRDTMARAFARRGYRTVAAIPAIWHSWPEGAFYGFDQIYTGGDFGYEGPPFGWWGLPDQFTLAKLDRLERQPGSRRPLFAFFPTVSTHAPFVPTPPYQPDWARMLNEHPYDRDARDRAFAEQPDWLNLSPSYIRAVSYAYQMFAGYLRMQADKDCVIVMLGDHQPPALVSGEGAPWDVPVHVITGRQEILERLRGHGFTSGLTPMRPSLGRMSQLTPVLMDALSSPR